MTQRVNDLYDSKGEYDSKPHDLYDSKAHDLYDSKGAFVSDFKGYSFWTLAGIAYRFFVGFGQHLAPTPSKNAMQ